MKRALFLLAVAAMLLGAAVLIPSPGVRAQNPDEILPAASAAKAKALLQQAIEGLGGADYLNVHHSDCSAAMRSFSTPVT